MTDREDRCRKFKQLDDMLKEIRQAHDIARMELMADMRHDAATECVFPDADGVIQVLSIKRQTKYDIATAESVYELMSPAQVDAGRQFITRENKEVVKVDGLRANQLEKLGGNVAETIRRSRDLASREYLSIKESK